MQVAGQPTCAIHAGNGASEAKPPVFPIDHVVKMTEMESLKLAALDAEMRNLLLAVRNSSLELDALRTRFEREARGLVNQKEQQEADLAVRKKSYIDFVTELAAKYGLEPTKMTFDTDSQVLRDLREEQQKE